MHGWCVCVCGQCSSQQTLQFLPILPAQVQDSCLDLVSWRSSRAPVPTPSKQSSLELVLLETECVLVPRLLKKYPWGYWPLKWPRFIYMLPHPTGVPQLAVVCLSLRDVHIHRSVGAGGFVKNWLKVREALLTSIRVVFQGQT